MNKNNAHIFILTGMAVIFMAVGLRNCADGCPAGKTWVRGVFGWECVQK